MFGAVVVEYAGLFRLPVRPAPLSGYCRRSVSVSVPGQRGWTVGRTTGVAAAAAAAAALGRLAAAAWCVDSGFDSITKLDLRSAVFI